MAEKSARPRASASLRSARPMRRTVGRARIVSATMRTCSCAMVVPPEQTKVAIPVLITPCRDPGAILTRVGENSFGAVPADRNGTPAVGRGIAVRQQDVRYGASVSFAAADDENQLPDGDHRCRVISSAEPKPFPPPA